MSRLPRRLARRRRGLAAGGLIPAGGLLPPVGSGSPLTTTAWRARLDPQQPRARAASPCLPHHFLPPQPPSPNLILGTWCTRTGARCARSPSACASTSSSSASTSSATGTTISATASRCLRLQLFAFSLPRLAVLPPQLHSPTPPPHACPPPSRRWRCVAVLPTGNQPAGGPQSVGTAFKLFCCCCCCCFEGDIAAQYSDANCVAHCGLYCIFMW